MLDIVGSAAFFDQLVARHGTDLIQLDNDPQFTKSEETRGAQSNTRVQPQ